MSAQTTTGVVVICTRNRSADVERALRSIAEGDRPRKILVIDSSDGDSTETLVARRVEGGEDIDWVRARPGLTHQRNVALDRLSGQDVVVHFIDDDVEVSSDYFTRLERHIGSDGRIGGAGGVVRGGERRRPGFATRLTLLDSVRPGVVLRSGFNVGAFEYPDRVDVDWLPGCAMSFRVTAIGERRFDESRTGYALGEDVDFGLKMSSAWRLVHVPDTYLIHHESPANRIKREVLAVQAVHNRWKLSRDFPSRVRPWAVVIGSVALALKYVVNAVRRDRAMNMVLARSTVVGLATVGKLP